MGQLLKPAGLWGGVGGGVWSGRLEQDPPGILDMLGCSYVGGIRLGGPQQGPWGLGPTLRTGFPGWLGAVDLKGRPSTSARAWGKEAKQHSCMANHL